MVRGGDVRVHLRVGEISLATEEPRLQYGRVHMNQVLQEMRASRFEEALRSVSARHANA